MIFRQNIHNSKRMLLFFFRGFICSISKMKTNPSWIQSIFWWLSALSVRQLGHLFGFKNSEKSTVFSVELVIIVGSKHLLVNAGCPVSNTFFGPEINSFQRGNVICRVIFPEYEQKSLRLLVLNLMSLWWCAQYFLRVYWIVFFSRGGSLSKKRIQSIFFAFDGYSRYQFVAVGGY